MIFVTSCSKPKQEIKTTRIDSLLVFTDTTVKHSEINNIVSIKPEKYFFSYSDCIKYSQIESRLSVIKREYLIDKIFPHFEERYNVYDKFQENFENSLSFLYLNEDTLIDCIFEGWSGAESNDVEFYINKGNYFERSFSFFQHLSKLEFRSRKLFALEILDFGCCAEFMEFKTFYSFVNDKPKADSAIVKYTLTEIPETFFNKINEIKTTSLTNLRCNSIVLDSGRYCTGDLKGNILAELKPNTKLKSIATKTDTLGNIWRCVVFKHNPKDYIKHYYYLNNDSIINYVIGWIQNE